MSYKKTKKKNLCRTAFSNKYLLYDSWINMYIYWGSGTRIYTVYFSLYGQKYGRGTTQKKKKNIKNKNNFYSCIFSYVLILPNIKYSECMVSCLSLLHYFVQQSLNSDSVQVQILLAACLRFGMERISDYGPGWK